VLSVARAAAEAAERAVATGAAGLWAVARAAAEGAAAALARTPEQLPALARAGVVDAGGRGLVVLLEALVAVVAEDEHAAGEERPAGEKHAEGAERAAGAEGATGEKRAAGVEHAGGEERATHDRGVEAPGAVDPSPHTFHSGAGPGRFGYEVQYLLEADGAAVARLRAALAGLGDSLVVVGDGGEPPTWHVHVHVDDVGAAIEAGVAAGRPYHISVTRFADQIAEREREREHDRERERERHRVRPERGAVVVAAGEGLAALFEGEGAAVVRGNPSPAEILDAVRATGAAAVVVLPNDKDARVVAAVAAREAQATGVRVSVVPTSSPVQALAALAVRDLGRPFEDDVIAMAEAAGACRSAEVTVAAREALTVAGRCRPGDVLGLVEGEVYLIGERVEPVCRDLLDRLLGGGGELVTLLTGADAPAGLAEALTAHLASRWPFVEVQHYAGGQPHYPLLVGVE
uniref:DAK2 domain-containing protein n=1 Tax=Rhizomonospora bruguierae TaxID=1581705 RepID=UPI001BCA8286